MEKQSETYFKDYEKKTKGYEEDHVQCYKKQLRNCIQLEIENLKDKNHLYNVSPTCIFKVIKILIDIRCSKLCFKPKIVVCDNTMKNRSSGNLGVMLNFYCKRGCLLVLLFCGNWNIIQPLLQYFQVH